jgi:hypothetical protein
MEAAERAEIFTETANRIGLPEAIVEKDFWVSWMLKQLFSIEALQGTLLFKGGTSLSKLFHAINRFSEDIDLAVDYGRLGFSGTRDPKQPNLSRSRQSRILAEMSIECQRYIAGDFLTAVRQRCAEALGTGAGWTLEIDSVDPHVVRFSYPTGVSAGTEYVAPQVILELGTHAEFVPRDTFTMKSFVAEEFPGLFGEPDVTVTALLAKRTFWEKATILHAEYHRPPEKALPGRYSRHYYDVAMMAQGPIRQEALADPELLAQVVRHKRAFYPSGWARYDLARPGSLRLAPAGVRLPALKQDYRNMAVMIFGKPPSLEGIVETLGALEEEVNSH